MAKPSFQIDLTFKHLQLLLMRVDLLIHREVKRWQTANANAADLTRGEYISDAEVNALLQQPFGMHWRYMVAPDEEMTVEKYDRALQRADAQIALLLNESPNSNDFSRLSYISELFELTEFERDMLLLAIAPALDLRYERLYGYLLDDATRRRPSVNLMLDLLSEAGPLRLLHLPYFYDTAPLFKYGFLRRTPEAGFENAPLLNEAVIPDPTLTSWLLGQYQPQEELGDAVKLVTVTDDSLPDDILIAGEQLNQLQHSRASNPLFALHGIDRGMQQALMRLLAYQLRQPLLIADVATLFRLPNADPTRVLRLIMRDAYLNRAIPYLDGWDVCFKDNAPPTALLDLICEYRGVVALASSKRWHPRSAERARPILWLECEAPAYAQRRSLWDHYLAQDGDEGTLQVDKLAGQFLLRSNQVRNVVRSARDRAVQQGRPMAADDLFLAARAHSNPKLGDLARKITPRFGWDDLVLPGDKVVILREIVNMVLGRPRVLEEWGAGGKLAYACVTVLFAGPPGTGKTMAAEVIAKELELDLFKIDLSSVVSKYIGETEKNLERIFNEAQSSNAILFFDEADSIFGKRSEVKDAHDRYANIEVSYLLQRMESYDGVTILATNLRANLDEAFMRRLQFALDFPFPEWQDRLRIWETLFPPSIPRSADIDFKLFAQRFRLAGGNIRNIIVSAAFLAANDGQIVTTEHLMHGAKRELQKMGRLVSKEDFEI